MTYLLGILATVCGICAAIFSFLSKAQSADDKAITRQWFLLKWERVRETPWKDIPEKLVVWLVRQKDGLSTHIKHLLDGKLGYTQIYALPLWVGLGMWAMEGPAFAAGTVLIAIVGTIGDYFIQTRRLGLEHGYTHGRNFLECTVYSCVGVSFVYCYIAWSFVLTNIPIAWAAVVASVVVPLIGMHLALPSLYVLRVSQAIIGRFSHSFADIYDREWLLFALSGAFSYVLSFYALLLGTYTTTGSPTTAVSFQLITVNVFFDALTVVTSLVVLGYAARAGRGQPWIIFAFLIDVLLAALFACLSLRIGLSGGPESLSMAESFHVLLAWSINGSHFEISPYFWLMHTTFIPTGVLFFTICLCWTLKGGALFAEWMTGKGKDADEPLGLVAALFTLLATLLGSITYLLTLSAD